MSALSCTLVDNFCLALGYLVVIWPPEKGQRIKMMLLPYWQPHQPVHPAFALASALRTDEGRTLSFRCLRRSLFSAFGFGLQKLNEHVNVTGLQQHFGSC
ncbi:unnamed protein product [Polarella glacialis]|uniref:Secreted protein n=1 Tax=Polarella glacialis TaxID=89957 RepID=A0A813HHW7_POLGL|nr:unnamed protein product [Polarella glacialis]CAE8637190.1 unnamed protein product [Polarella glacialis]